MTNVERIATLAQFLKLSPKAALGLSAAISVVEEAGNCSRREAISKVRTVPDLADYLQSKLKEMEAAGEFDEIYEEMIAGVA